MRPLPLRLLARGGRRRGSALILAVLVILVLTIVGVGVAYFTQVEDQASGNVRLSKAAFYGAEAGLRIGEQQLNTAMGAAIGPKGLLLYGGTTPNLALPGGGSGIPLRVLGTEFQNVIIPGSGPGRADVPAYSLYIRNNLEDPGGPLMDTDNKINLIAVGFAVSTKTSGATTSIDQVLTTKILEEQVNLAAQGTESGAQKGTNAGGTGAGQKGTGKP